MTIGFTNGTFDGLHAGHRYMLSAAKAQCARLIVAVNEDEDVRRLKGDGRPLNKLYARRVALIEHLGSENINLYTFRDANLEAMIEKLRPDIIFKGGDYKSKDVRGRKLVESWGGKVVIIPILPGHGTSRPKGGTRAETCRP